MTRCKTHWTQNVKPDSWATYVYIFVDHCQV